MKAKFIKGTTLRGKPVNGGDVLDLDEQDYRLFVNQYKDAVPYTEPATKAEPAAIVAEAVTETASGEPKVKGRK